MDAFLTSYECEKFTKNSLSLCEQSGTCSGVLGKTAWFPRELSDVAPREGPIPQTSGCACTQLVEVSQRQLFFEISKYTFLLGDKIAYKMIEEVNTIILAGLISFTPSFFGQAKTSFLVKVLVAPSWLENYRVLSWLGE